MGNFQVFCCLNRLGQALPFLCSVRDATCSAGCSHFLNLFFPLGPPSSARFLHSKVRREFTDSSAQGPHLICSLLDLTPRALIYYSRCSINTCCKAGGW